MHLLTVGLVGMDNTGFSSNLKWNKIILTTYFFPFHLFLTFFTVQGKFQALEFLTLTETFTACQEFLAFKNFALDQLSALKSCTAQDTVLL